MRASVIGATGYAGVELLRLLDGHPEAEIATIHPKAALARLLPACIRIWLVELKRICILCRKLSRLQLTAM